MPAIALTSLLPTLDQVVNSLVERSDTALVCAPGSGSTTFLDSIAKAARTRGLHPARIDLGNSWSAEEALLIVNKLGQDSTGPRSTARPAGFVRKLFERFLPGDAGGTESPQLSSDRPNTLIIDHAGKLGANDLKAWLGRLETLRTRAHIPCLWVGPLDARGIRHNYGVELHSRPSAHITFPHIPRDELLSTYRAIAEDNHCRWGEAILHLLLDFCGNDLALVRSATEYFRGEWSDRLSDTAVWDRLSEWLTRDPSVQAYRKRLQALPTDCQRYLAFLRAGCKPPCARPDVGEEHCDPLRTLCLEGFLVLNLLPRYYAFRNLTARLVVLEADQAWSPFGPESLLRRAATDRAGQLVQDVEAMMRGLLVTLFRRLGDTEVRKRLEGRQTEAEFIPKELTGELMRWVAEKGGAELKTDFVRFLDEHRKAFRERNSVWARAKRLMDDEPPEQRAGAVPDHLRCVEFLTFAEMADLLVDSIDEIFPKPPDAADAKAKLKERWREGMKERWRDGLARIRALRNRVAHLRNVDFRSMEELSNTVEALRRDSIRAAGLE